MFRNYLKIGWRNLLKNKIFSLINILGLAAGLASFILIALFVWDELSYDQHHEHAKRIYRIHSDIRFGGDALNLAVSPDPMGAALKNDYPQVEAYTRIYNSDGSKLVKKGDQYVTEEAIAYADSTFFNVFSFESLYGNLETALHEPNTVVLTESSAKKYFGTSNVLGKTIETDDRQSTLYKITAVIKDMPRNGHFRFDMLFSMDNLDYGFGNFLSANFFTYLLLKPNTDPKELEKQFPTFIQKHVLPQAQAFMDIKSMDDFEKAGNSLKYSLHPLTDIHLKSARVPELGVNGRMEYVWIFSAVALFILLLACINFMNLSTARSANRAREVGIRKVMGTDRKSLILQFIAESVLTVFLALLISFLIIGLAIPWFNDITAKEIRLTELLKPASLVLLVLLLLVVGLVAGIYPAFFLSSFQPIKVLKGKSGSGFRMSNLRNGLVIFQFATSIILMISTVLVYQQLNYIQSTRIGYNKDQLLIVDGLNALGGKAAAFKNEILKLTGVRAGTLSSYLPVQPSSRSNQSLSTSPVLDPATALSTQFWRVETEYLSVLGMEMRNGRWFSPDLPSDSSAVIINESAARIIGGGDPLGKKLYEGNDAGQGEKTVYEIVGVVKNFHFESLRQEIGPLVMRLGRRSSSGIFKVDTKNMADLIRQVQATWKKMAPAMPFSYRFMDESFDSMYRTEQRVGKLGLSFALIAILIACLGLFGLVTYMAEQRAREIGVRKVLGASIGSIVGLMSRDFLKLVLLAALIAFPVAYWAMDRWLQDYAFRISMGWWVFLLAGLTTVLIAFGTICAQALKSAMANPVKSLRTE